MARAIHRLQSLASTFTIILVCRIRWNQIEIVLVVVIVTRNFPQIDIVQIWSLDFFKATLVVLLFNQLCQLIINMSTIRKEKCAACRISRIPKEEILLLSN